METKVCKKCGQILPITEFNQVPSMKEGSKKANTMKNSASLQELQTFCKNILRYSPNYIKEEDIESKDKEP